MNMKSLRKNYENLTMLQRLALADQALGRNDESEALAIKNASPKRSYSQADFCELMTEILNIRLCNLVTRLGYIMQFDLFHQFELDPLDRKPNKARDKRISDNMRLSAYLYVRATDSWKAVNDELGLRQNFDEELGDYLLTAGLLEDKDRLMRLFAFSEEEAIAFARKEEGEKADKFRTINDEIAGYREMLDID
jgi:hypothetical protein